MDCLLCLFVCVIKDCRLTSPMQDLLPAPKVHRLILQKDTFGVMCKVNSHQLPLHTLVLSDTRFIEGARVRGVHPGPRFNRLELDLPPPFWVVHPNQLPLLIQKPLRLEGPGVLPVLRVVVDGEDVAPDLE